MIKPLKTSFKLEEDSNLTVEEQIKDRRNSESNYEWARNTLDNPLPIQERADHFIQQGKDYMKYRQIRHLW